MRSLRTVLCCSAQRIPKRNLQLESAESCVRQKVQTVIAKSGPLPHIFLEKNVLTLLLKVVFCFALPSRCVARIMLSGSSFAMKLCMSKMRQLLGGGGSRTTKLHEGRNVCTCCDPFVAIPSNWVGELRPTGRTCAHIEFPRQKTRVFLRKFVQNVCINHGMCRETNEWMT